MQLLLFVDGRPQSRDLARSIRAAVAQICPEADARLQVVDCATEPELVEHYRLVTTPALILLGGNGDRRHFSGSSLVEQLQDWLPRWRDQLLQETCESPEVEPVEAEPEPDRSLLLSSEVLRLSDEIFRLQSDNSQLSQQLLFREQMQAMLVHDLRNPLTAATLGVDTIDRLLKRWDGSSPLPLAPLLEQVRQQLREVDRLVGEILETGHGHSGTDLRLNPSEQDLAQLLQETLALLDGRLKLKQQTVQCDCPGDLPTVYADPGRIQQVFTNLLDNAIKYTPHGGQIRVAMFHRTSQRVEVSVDDDGPGIPREQQQRIFEATVRLDPSGNQNGYGLGLAVCQEIIQAHYGKIWVEAEPGVGSCFHFTLPVYRIPRL